MHIESKCKETIEEFNRYAEGGLTYADTTKLYELKMRIDSIWANDAHGQLDLTLFDDGSWLIKIGHITITQQGYRLRSDTI